ncbi:MAG: hypothetical protein IT254_03880 [Chitinophagaceae bacterium]|nr:hypothetical protein [Chitinophagaceae bacterium]
MSYSNNSSYYNILLRKQFKLLQAGQAKPVGTSAPIPGCWECNEIKPAMVVIAKFGYALGVPVDNLLEGSNNIVLKKNHNWRRRGICIGHALRAFVAITFYSCIRG